MEATPFPRYPGPGSSGTATSEPARFVETLEHSRFIEFCEACKQYHYIGLCFGAPGIGKTLSAIRYSQADEIGQLDPWTPFISARLLDTVLYTPSVVNTPGKVGTDLRSARERLLNISMRPADAGRGLFRSFVKNGTSPQRVRISSRSPVSGLLALPDDGLVCRRRYVEDVRSQSQR